MRYYILAGEASGDLHGAELMKELKKQDPTAEIRFWGGDLMAAAGGTIVKHYRDLAFMGFAEVLFNLKTILGNIKICKRDILEFRPDAIIFIDYPGFNMRIAKWAKNNGFPTHYYISPQIWAWKENRITAIKRDIDHMYVILPFEKDFYEKKHNYKVEFVGHPLLDVINKKKDADFSEFRTLNNLSDKPIIALLPGSRKQEITKMLSVMTSVADSFLDYQFVIAGAPGQEDSFYEQFLSNKNILFVSNQTYNLLSISHAALVTSGTATLETALFKVPEVVCYKGNWASYQIAKRIITLKYISLVNLIMDRLVVEELIQEEFNKTSLTKALKKILNPDHRATLFHDYELLEEQLGRNGAAKKTAMRIVQSLQ
ncbi:lipid-A-disaccharide synthase [Flavobacterium ardleyense]|uniref:lipid-A-disaccharide synthase n=1 Tax=Flavobacterium ardleyense TaxID=2038737 RepID=UPI00298C15E1|nr:lipid-A-disaccharide synthase [Flavobacterium ardleyense]